MSAPPAHPLLSIVIPSFNYGHLLPRVVQSVLMQMESDYELIVVDDGSSDTTEAVLAQLADAHPQALRRVYQTNAGAGAARNHGLRLSRGAFVLLLDADDELLPGALGAIRAALLAAADATVFLGGRVTRRPDGLEKTHPPSDCRTADPTERIADYLLRKEISISHGAFVAARGLLEQCPYPDQIRGREDIPVFAYLLAYGRIARIDQPLVLIHKHADSLRHTGQRDEEAELELADAIFLRLPPACQRLKPAYLAQRRIALSAAALMAGHRKQAWRHMAAAWRAAPGVVLQPRQTKKLVKGWLGLG